MSDETPSDDLMSRDEREQVDQCRLEAERATAEEELKTEQAPEADDG